MKLLEVANSKPNIWLPDKDGTIDISGSHVGSLVGAPDVVRGDFKAGTSALATLQFGPRRVDGSYFCNLNHLTSLDGVAPHIGNSLFLNANYLKNLHNIHKHIKYVEMIDARHNFIESHVLGLLLIKGLQGVYLENKYVQAIINSHLDIANGDRDINKCQEELIDAGYPNFARL